MNLWDYKTRMDTRSDPLYKSTIGVWNDCHFNSRTSIGYSMKLIKECRPRTPQDWETYYLKSGEEGKRSIQNIPNNTSKKTQSLLAKDINANHGKTAEDLEEIAKRFRGALASAGINVSPEQAFNYTYIRAIDEAWIGYKREMTAERALARFCRDNSLTLSSSSTHTDLKRGVDYEIYQNGKLVCGVQVKGSAYKTAVKESAACRKLDANLSKMIGKYKTEKQVPVFFMFVERNRNIENLADFKKKVLSRINRVKPDKGLAEQSQQPGQSNRRSSRFSRNPASQKETPKPPSNGLITLAEAIEEAELIIQEQQQTQETKSRGTVARGA